MTKVRTNAEILRAARVRIADPANWDSKAEPTTGGKRQCGLEAVVSELAGSFGSFSLAPVLHPVVELLRTASLEVFGHRMPYVNDVLGHESVMAVYKRAIEVAEKEEA